MRIAILGSKGIPAAYGGFETFAEHLALGLTEKNVNVTVYCESGENSLSNYHGVHLIYLPAVNLGFLKTIMFDLRCLWHARKKFDTVYMLGYGASLFCFIPRLWGTQVWINMDGIEWQRSKWNFIGRIYLRIMERCAIWTANKIIADAKEIKRSLCQRYGNIQHCSVIAYGADLVKNAPSTDFLNEWNLMPEQYHLIVCRLEPENHVLELIQGYLNSASKYPLLIVGGFSNGSAYSKMLRDYSCERVRFIGGIFDKQKLHTLRYYCNSYLHGHSVGGTNPSLLEALACGNIVLAHDNCFNREVMGRTGNYFSSLQEISLLINEIEALDPSTRAIRRCKAKKIISAQYTWSHIVQQYYELLKSVHKKKIVR